MKKILITLLLSLSAAGVQARVANNAKAIASGTVWNNSTVDYFAEVKSDGSIIFTGCDEGQDLAFRLTPKGAKKGEYLIADENPEWCVNPFNQSSLVKQEQWGDKLLLCLYDDEGRLRDVISPLDDHDAMLEADWKRTRQLMGEYTSRRGEPMRIEGREQMYFADTFAPYRKITFNSLITNLVEIKGGTRMDGLWEVEITPEGLKMRQMTTDDEYYRYAEPTGDEMEFVWARKDIPRFQYAGEILLNGDMLRSFDKSVLRLMRNEILFHHGYVPTSDDLRAYLADKKWYAPRKSNDGVFDELSVVEKLNIELIKTAEELNDTWRTSEEVTECDVDTSFDFEKYHQAIVEQAELNLNYRKSLDDIRLVDYALVDVDHDGLPEIWVRGDEGQDFQGIYSIQPDNVARLVNNSDARSELFFLPGAVGSRGYYGEGEFRESISTLKNSRPAESCSKYVLINNFSEDMEVLEENYFVNGDCVSREEYADFCERLGETCDHQVKWSSVDSLPASAGR